LRPASEALALQLPIMTIQTKNLIMASTRVLEKCGFEKISERVDPENNVPIWRWERPIK
jgi:hypothetical protein